MKKEKIILVVDIIIIAVFCAAVAFAIASLCTGYLKVTVKGKDVTMKLMELADEDILYKAAAGLTIAALAVSPVIIVMRLLFIITEKGVFEIITLVLIAVCTACLLITIVLIMYSGNTDFAKAMEDTGGVKGFAVGFWLAFASFGCLAISFSGGLILDYSSGRIGE